MKKITAALFAIGILSACQTEKVIPFKGKTYLLQNRDNLNPISLSFDSSANDYSGKVVNNYFGSYTTDETNGISFNPAGATLMMGPREEMEEEGQYFQILPSITKYDFDNETLIFTTSDGKELVFKEATAASAEDDE